MGPSNTSFLSFRVIFHFHDSGRKGIFPMIGENNSPVLGNLVPKFVPEVFPTSKSVQRDLYTKKTGSDLKMMSFIHF